MESGSPKKLGVGKRTLGIAALVAIFALGLFFELKRSAHRPLLPTQLWVSPVFVALFMVAGAVVLVLAAAIYGVVLWTGALTFNCRSPVFPGFKIRCYIAFLVLSLLLSFGIGYLIGAPLSMIVVALVPSPLIPSLCMFVCLSLALCFFIWFQILAPLGPIVIRRRLKALGLPQLPLDRGTFVGLSNPNKSSFKKLTLVEDDIGFLWFDSEMLIYKGDSVAWRIHRYQMQPIERKADAGSTLSYFGAVDVHIRFYDDNGTNHHYRLHAGRGWTMTARARELDRLADVLEAWRNGMTPLLGAPRKGFEVVQSSLPPCDSAVTPVS